MIGAAAYVPTETELKWHRRRMAFREKIAEKAAALAESKQPRETAPEAVPAQPDPPAEVVTLEPAALALPPMKAPWFSIAGVVVGQAATIREIQDAVCDHYGVLYSDLISHRRTKDLVRPRQVAAYLCKKLTPHSLPTIGRKFSGRDHTTILHAVRKISALIEIDGELAATVAALSKQLETAAGS